MIAGSPTAGPGASAWNALAIVESAVNGLLELDAAFPGVLQGLAGKTIALEVIDFDRVVYVHPTARGLHFTGSHDGRIDVRIRGTVPELLAYAAARAGRPGGRLELSGEVAVAQELQAILGRLDLDWEEAASRWTGDIAARKLGNLTRTTAAYLRDAARSLALDASEFLRYEKRVTPDRFEVDQLNASVERLRDDVERMKVRLHRVARRIRKAD